MLRKFLGTCILNYKIIELRVMGGSDVLMVSQYGNKHGTLAIEPVSTRSTKNKK